MSFPQEENNRPSSVPLALVVRPQEETDLCIPVFPVERFGLKYDTNGAQQWIRQTGTSSRERAYDVTVDSSGNVYVTGSTEGAFTGANAGGYDIFLTKYNSSGTQHWIRQIGTSSSDSASGVAVDSSGNVYVTGRTYGALTGANAGSGDIFLTKYNSSGDQQWIKQIGTSGDDKGLGVDVDSADGVYVTGYTSGAFSGFINTGHKDVFLLKYDTDGNLQ